MGGKSDEPKAPNYENLAKNQAELDRSTAQQITAWNRPTQVNPYGRLQWSQDDAGNWTQQELLDPRLQTISDQNLGLQKRFGDQINAQGQFQGPESVQYDPAAGDAMSNALYESVMGRARQEQGRQQDALDTKLKQQGLQPGTEAYDRAMRNMLTAHGDVSTKAALDARLAGGQEARNEFGARTVAQQNAYQQKMGEYRLPWEMLSSAQGAAAGMPRPQFQGFSAATGYQPANMIGAAQKGFETEMGKYNAEQQKKGNTLNTAMQVGAMVAMSDIRLKEAVQFVGTLLGRNLFRWTWNEKANKLGLVGDSFGVMAHECPDIVVMTNTGYLAVDYGRLFK